MRTPLRRSRILILLLALLCLCGAAPSVLLSFFGQFSPSLEQTKFLGGTSRIVKNRSLWQSVDHLNSIEEEVNEGLRELPGILYKDEDGTVHEDERNSSSDSDMGSSVPDELLTNLSRRGQLSDDGGGKGFQNQNLTSFVGMLQKRSPTTRLMTDEKIRYMEDQVIAARAYLHFAQPSSHSHLVRELKLRIKEIERVLSHASKDSDLHRSALQKMKAMENTLYKANKAYPDCSATASKLRAMTYSMEEQLRAQKKQASYLIQLATRTFPKALHCLSMRLTTEYFAMLPEKRQLPNRLKVQKSYLYHYAIFSDNILACAVVVNSTISSSVEPEKIVFHVVTDSLNFPAMMMWFMMNPPGAAVIDIHSMDEFEWLPPNYGSIFKKQGVLDPRYNSPLNHLRFHLPEIFPSVNKILLLDHDVVVQKDLGRLWSVDMKGNVIGVVQTCRREVSAHRLELLVNFSDPAIARGFNPKACTWAFGMNIFDLHAWRKKGLMKVYQKWFQVGLGKRLWKAGSLPLGQLVFYNHTFILDPKWHMVGLGQDSTLRKVDIETAAVIHYSGQMKPWLEIGILKYRGYWSKFLDYDIPHLQQCNVHP